MENNLTIYLNEFCLIEKESISMLFTSKYMHSLLLMFLILVKSTRCTLYVGGSLRLKGILVFETNFKQFVVVVFSGTTMNSFNA